MSSTQSAFPWAVAIIGVLAVIALIAGGVFVARRRKGPPVDSGVSTAATSSSPSPSVGGVEASGAPLDSAPTAVKQPSELAWSDLSDADQEAFREAARDLGLL